MRVRLIPARSKLSILPALKSNVSKLRKYKKIGLASTIQFSNQLPRVKKFLENKGFKIVLEKPKKRCGQGIKAKEKGQVLGCDASVCKKSAVNCWLYIGTGKFHPLAIALETDKPVLILNPFAKKLVSVSEKEKKLWLAKKAANLSKLREAKQVGIILSTKPGQYNPNLAERVAKKLAAQGKKCFFFIGDTLNPQEALNFSEIGVWVNTACPRLVEDDWPKPIVNAEWV